MIEIIEQKMNNFSFLLLERERKKKLISMANANRQIAISHSTNSQFPVESFVLGIVLISYCVRIRKKHE
jgi:hypothetical protein